MRRTPRRRRGTGAGLRRRQQGVVLFIALIVLVALMLASISLVRSVDTANVIAGNLAFKQATVQAADYGIETATAELPNIVGGGGGTDILPAATGPEKYWYFATRRVTDPYGVPTLGMAPNGAATPIDWNNVPIARAVAGNDVRIVVERLCLDPIVDQATSCFNEGKTGGGTKAVGKEPFASVTSLYYRVTAHVTGPRNTISIVQAIVSY